MDEIIIISVGGSLIAPEDPDPIFLQKFRKLILKHTKSKKFFIICGGGKVCRKYQNVAKKVIKLEKEDADWLGIHVTRLNAHLMRTIFRDIAFPRIIKDPNEKITLKRKQKVLIAAGWKPGCSTDYDAVLLAKTYGIKKIVNLSNIDYIYNRDPRKYKNAKPIKQISWKNLRRLLPKKWDPGLNSPFDPIAAREAQKLKLEVFIMNGKNLKNFEDYLNNKKFVGTIIKNG